MKIYSCKTIKFLTISLVILMALGGVVSASECGDSWTSIHTTNSSYDFRGVANNGSRIVVAGTSGRIEYTDNGGTSWTVCSGTGSNHFYDLIYCSSKNMFVAVGKSGTIYTSTNGATWTSRTSGTTENLEGVCWNGTKFVAVGAEVSCTSTNGTTWTANTQTGKNMIKVSCNSSGVLVAAGNGSKAFRSTNDGDTWTGYTVGTSQNFKASAYGNEKFVIGSSAGQIWYSTDNGINWAEASGTDSREIWDIEYCGGRFMGCGSYTSSKNIIVSTNGTSWSQKAAGSERAWSIGYDGLNALCAGNSSTVYTSSNSYLLTIDVNGIEGVSGLVDPCTGEHIVEATGTTVIHAKLAYFNDTNTTTLVSDFNSNVSFSGYRGEKSFAGWEINGIDANVDGNTITLYNDTADSQATITAIYRENYIAGAHASQPENFPTQQTVGIGTCNTDFDPPSNLNNLPSGYWVDSNEELVDALEACANNNGGIIYITPGANIDMSNYSNVEIPANTWIRSNRGKLVPGVCDAAPGGTIYTTTQDGYPLFVTAGSNIKISGIQLMGPDPTIGTSPYGEPLSEGIAVSHENVEIYNCEISNWSHAGIFLKNINNLNRDSVHIHHNYIHHCRRTQLGYGITHLNSKSLIEYNGFDYCRHAIAGWGDQWDESNPYAADGYEACYNWVGPHMSGLSFDMHGGYARRNYEEPDTDVAGSEIIIHDNTFETTQTVGEYNCAHGVIIAGNPTKGCWIYHNLFYHSTTFYDDGDWNIATFQFNWISPYNVCRFHAYNNKWKGDLMEVAPEQLNKQGYLIDGQWGPDQPPIPLKWGQ